MGQNRANRCVVFLSYHSPDETAALALKAAIEARERASRVFFAPSSLNAGAFWLPRIGTAITEADAFLLLLGNGLGAWQKLEYYEALDRRARDPAFPIVPVVTTATTPGLPFLRQLHWIGTPAPHTDPHLSAIIGALKGEALAEVSRPWRATNPIPRPSGPAGGGRCLLLRQGRGDHRDPAIDRAAVGKADRADRKFGRRQVVTRAGRCRRDAQAPTLAGGR